MSAEVISNLTKFIFFFVPHLPKTQKEENKVYSSVSLVVSQNWDTNAIVYNRSSNKLSIYHFF